MENENEEELVMTPAAYAVLALAGAAVFAVGMGIGHVNYKLAERFYDRKIAKKYPKEKEF